MARQEAHRRQDVYTTDAYAWALFVNGRVREARAQMTRALGVGIRDADMMYRAGAILSTLNERAAAVRL